MPRFCEESSLNSLHNVQRFLAEDPALVPHFAPERSKCSLKVADASKVQMVAAMYADVLNIGLHALSAVPAAEAESAWEPYCRDLLERSPALRAEVDNNPWGYPRLAPIAKALEDARRARS